MDHTCVIRWLTCRLPSFRAEPADRDVVAADVVVATDVVAAVVVAADVVTAVVVAADVVAAVVAASDVCRSLPVYISKLYV